MKLAQVTDLKLIIFLVAKNHHIQDSKVNGNKSIIYFEDTDELQKDIVNFVNGVEIINITDYLSIADRVKTLIQQNKNK